MTAKVSGGCPQLLAAPSWGQPAKVSGGTLITWCESLVDGLLGFRGDISTVLAPREQVRYRDITGSGEGCITSEGCTSNGTGAYNEQEGGVRISVAKKEKGTAG